MLFYTFCWHAACMIMRALVPNTRTFMAHSAESFNTLVLLIMHQSSIIFYMDPRLLASSYIMIFTGELIEKEEAKLLGQILHKTSFYDDFEDEEGAEQITQTIVKEKMTYEYLQEILNEDSTTQFLSHDLKDKLRSSEFTNLLVVNIIH